MAGDASTTALEVGRGRGILQILGGLYLSPGVECVVILRRPRYWLPVLGLIVVNLAFTAVWLRQVDPAEFMKAQLEEQGRWENLSPEQREGIVQQQVKIFPILGWVSAVLGAPIVVLVVASLYLFVFRFFFASDVKFKQSLSLAAYIFLAVSLVTVPLTLLTLALQGDWNVDPRDVLQANPSLFLDKESTPKPLYSLAGSLDLFSFWALWLLCKGYGIASSRRARAAAPGVFAPWVLYVLGKMGFAALF